MPSFLLLLLEIRLIDPTLALAFSVRRRRRTARDSASRRCGARSGELRRIGRGRRHHHLLHAIDREAAALVGRADVLRQLRRVDAGTSASAHPVRIRAASGCAAALTGFANVTPASLSLLPCSSSASFSRPCLLARARSLRLATSWRRISSFTSSNGRGAAGLYSTMRAAISVFGPTSIASVLRFAAIDSGENSAWTNFALPNAICCALRARRPVGDVFACETERLGDAAPANRPARRRDSGTGRRHAANFCATFWRLRSASIWRLHLVERRVPAPA